jgi:malate dehydrogenase (oxaloacetate-decarboxylating)
MRYTNPMNYNEEALKKHKQLKGKIAIVLKDPLDSPEKLSTYYTPGVAAVSSYVAAHPEQARDYTWLNNSVAVISDGTAVLGLGNIGPYGALPVMEGKCMLFKHFANIDAVPIVLDVHSADEIVATVKALAPSFGGINLEDIAAPICFEVEARLKAELKIPVMHDDQHGTAIVTLAGLINATKITGRRLQDCKIVCVGAGAAGTAVMKLLYKYAQPEILAIDSQGIVSPDRTDLNPEKAKLLDFTNPNQLSGSLADALKDADVFIGVSKPGLLTADLIKTMHPQPIVFAMANPLPEIMPDVAKAAGAAVVATGRSDFPNQVNNALAFPGIFRGALDNQVQRITDQHKIAAAEALAGLVENPTPEMIIPSVLDPRLVPAISRVIV